MYISKSLTYPKGDQNFQVQFQNWTWKSNSGPAPSTRPVDACRDDVLSVQLLEEEGTLLLRPFVREEFSSNVRRWIISVVCVLLFTCG